jgi:hypothetical protein
MAVVHYYVVPLDVNATDAAQAIGLL